MGKTLARGRESVGQLGVRNNRDHNGLVRKRTSRKKCLIRQGVWWGCGGGGGVVVFGGGVVGGWGGGGGGWGGGGGGGGVGGLKLNES